MERETATAARAENLSESALPPLYREPFWLWRGVIGLLAGLWQLLRSVAIYVIISGIGVSFAVSWLTSQDNADPNTWRLSQYVASLGQNLLVALGVFGILASVAFVAWRADLTNQVWEGRKAAEKEAKLRQANKEEVTEAVESGVVKAAARMEGSIALTDYAPLPMRKLQPTDCAVAFVDTTYLLREADTLARNALREAAARYQASEGTVGKGTSGIYQTSEATIGKGAGGIYVVGQHNIGKSRLVWEALRAVPELQEWTFVQWPSAAGHPFPVESMKGRRVIVLVDTLEDYADSADIRVLSRLNRVPRDFAEAKIALIIIATARDGFDRKVGEKLAPLVGSLVPVEMGPISPEAAAELRADLETRGIEPHEWDAITPGSIITGRAMPETYKQLSEDARHVMKVLRLFDSVGFGADTVITKARVCAVADALFDVPRLRWRAACDELIAQDLIDWQWILPSYERVIVAKSSDALGIVSDYPLGGEKDNMEIEDWPLLYEVFKARRDIEAIVALGRAWWESDLPFRYAETGLPTKLDYLKRAADCFRTALAMRDASTQDDPSVRALVQWYLADVLLGQNGCMQSTEQSPTRVEVLQEAAAAYQAAREYYTGASDPDTWISLTTSLASTFNEQSKFAEGDAKGARLDDAEELANAALAALTTQTPAEVKIQCETILAYIHLHRAQLAVTREEAAGLLTEARAAAEDALRDRQESDPGAFNREALALAQGNCAYMLRFQASQASGEERISTLKQSEALLHNAIDILPEAEVSSADTRMWLQSLLADILLQLGRLAPAAAEVRRDLSEAETHCRDIMDTPAARNAPETLAWIQGVYGGVCAQQVEFAEEAKREELLNEAGDYCAAALDAANRESAPEDWAGTRLNAALLLLRIAQYLGPSERETACSWLAQGRAFLAEALGVYAAPVYFAEHQQALVLHEQIEQHEGMLGCMA
jgi:hypothetical protein